MAKVLQPFTLSFQVEDQNGDSGTISFYAAASTPPATLAAVAPEIMNAIDPLVLGQTTRYGFTSNYLETAYAQPTSANGNAEQKATFTFVTTTQKKVSISLPTFDPSLVLDQTKVPFADALQIVDITNVNVAAFVTGCITGFTDGTVTIYPSGRRVEDGDIIALHSANYLFAPSRTRRARRG